MKLVVDACVFVAQQIEEQPEFAAADEFLDHCVKSGTTIHAPAIALAEVAGAVARVTDEPTLGDLAVLRLNHIPRFFIRAIDDGFARSAARLAARHKLGGADAQYASLAKEMKCPLITNDAELLSRCPPTMTVLTPAGWLEASRA